MTYDIQESFDRFLTQVYPDVAASSTQGTEMCKVWFAANLQLYMTLIAAVEVSSDKGLEIFKSLHVQLEDFMKEQHP